MDALTSLTGSGPAFFCEMIESIIDAGIAMGFSREVASDLSFQMVKGSLALLEELHPSELKIKAASPGGTTVAGLKKWEEESLKDSIIQTFLAAYERAKELSEA
jgi:pyrroline-5-carboxylate reductase